MPSVYFILFELIIYIQFILCLRHAWKRGAGNLLRLFAGIIFGVALEYASIRQLQAYEYGIFMIMIADVPVCIGVAWSCILYSAMEFSDGSSLPYLTRPILDALLALNIDLALDTIAIRLGFWDWGQGLQNQYFGVPYPNFWGWFWVVFSFSLGYRLLARRKDWIGTWISAALGLITGMAGVLSTNSLMAFVFPYAYRGFVVALVISMAVVLIILLKPQFYERPVSTVAFWVPFLSHAYLLVAGLISGVILNPPALLLISITMSIIGFYLHKPSIQHILARGAWSLVK